MSKLEDLYEGKKRLERAGYKLTSDVLEDMDRLEEQLIKDEILPTLSKDIEPRLAKIQRELVLVVEYKPGEPISVALSRKANIAELLDAKLLEIEPISNEKVSDIQSPTEILLAEEESLEDIIGSSAKNAGKTGHKTGYKKSSPTALLITRQDGSTLMGKNASDTLVRAIVEAGIERVKAVGISYCGVSLVANYKDDKYGHAQEEVTRGVYVLKHSSTKRKKEWLDKINDALNLGWTIKIIE